jgi:CheY-like chemotaxis protein
MRTTPVILVCDDDEDDQMLIREAFGKAGLNIRSQSLYNGLELLEYLQSESPRPDIILLDLNMPLMNGFEALNWIKSHPGYSRIPVVIYTNSSLDADVKRCYTLGASFYLTKSASFDELVEKVQYWIENATLLPV